MLGIHQRTLRYLRPRGLLRADSERESNAAPDPTAIEACMRSALGVAGLAGVHRCQILEQPSDVTGHQTADSDADPDAERFGRRSRGAHVADALGWSLHAATTVGPCEICVTYVTQRGPENHCVRVPTGCESTPTCECLGSSVCLPPYGNCTDKSGIRGVSCDCPNC